MRWSIHFSDATDQAIDYCLQDVFPFIVSILLSFDPDDASDDTLSILLPFDSEDARAHTVSICTRIFASHAFNGNFLLLPLYDLH